MQEDLLCRTVTTFIAFLSNYNSNKIRQLRLLFKRNPQFEWVFVVGSGRLAEQLRVLPSAISFSSAQNGADRERFQIAIPNAPNVRQYFT